MSAQIELHHIAKHLHNMNTNNKSYVTPPCHTNIRHNHFKMLNYEKNKMNIKNR